MARSTITVVTPKGTPISQAEFARLESIIQTGARIRGLKHELKEHDAKRDRFRDSIVQRIEWAEDELRKLTDGSKIEEPQAVAS